MSDPTFRQAKNGYYYAHWRAGGHSRHESLRTKDFAQAQSRWRSALKDGIYDKTKDHVSYKAAELLTIDNLWKNYDEGHVQKKTEAPASIAYAWKNLEQHFASMTLDQVNQSSVDKYVEARKQGRIGRAVKDGTIRKELATLRACINWCAEPRRQIISSDSLPVFDLPPESPPRDRWLRMAEMQKLLDAAARMRRGDRLSRGERFLWIALEAPARKSAILELTWDRVDFDTNTIHFDIEGRRKTKKRRAAVAMSKGLRKILKRAHTEKTTNLVMDSKAEVWATIQLIVIEAGLSDQKKPKTSEKPKSTGISPHTLRHTAATHMARNGVSLWKIAKILGNTLAMVEKVYAKWTPEDPEGTVDRISAGKLEAAE